MNSGPLGASLSTRCPACGTAFKVAQDQLLMSDGWVRCGRCSEVFDGQEHLHDAGGAPEKAAFPEPAGSTFDFPDPSTFPHASGTPVAADSVKPAASMAEPIDASSIEASGVVVEPAGTDAAPAPWLGQWPSLELERAVEPIDTGRPGFPVPITNVATETTGTTGTTEVASPPVAAAAAAPDKPFDLTLAAALAEPDTSPSAEPAPGTPAGHGGFASLEPRDGPVMRWLRRLPGLGRLPLRSISAGALILLAAQAIHHSRDAIAAQRPALAPALAALCNIGGCTLSPLRRIDAITIEGASFARDPGGEGYQLTFEVRNRASTAVAMPAIEVTLLDTKEQAVVRRALTASELGTSDAMPARSIRSIVLPLSLANASALPPVVGYGIAAFYP